MCRGRSSTDTVDSLSHQTTTPVAFPIQFCTALGLYRHIRPIPGFYMGARDWTQGRVCLLEVQVKVFKFCAFAQDNAQITKVKGTFSSRRDGSGLRVSAAWAEDLGSITKCQLPTISTYSPGVFSSSEYRAWAQLSHTCRQNTQTYSKLEKKLQNHCMK